MNRRTYEHDDEDVSDVGTTREVTPDANALALLTRAEVDSQIATARAFPRSIALFVREVRELVTMDEASAASCIYSLPRGKERDPKTGKMVEKFVTGPSARFAEVLAYAFGNNRQGGRVVDSSGNSVIAQGVFHDLEKNVMITMETNRKITNRSGQRFSEDMVNVTGNAAAAIAHRNAVLKGIPRALWLPMYEKCRMVAVGDLGTLQQRRDKMVAWFAHKGVSLELVLAKLGKEGIEDIGLDELEILVGISTALRDGSASVEHVFGNAEPEPTSPAATGPQNAATVAGELRDRARAQQDAEKPQPEGEAPRHTGPSLAAAAGDDTGFDHPLADAMRATKKRDELDHLADRALAEVPKGPLRTWLTKTLYDEQLARLERELGAPSL